MKKIEFMIEVDGRHLTVQPDLRLNRFNISNQTGHCINIWPIVIDSTYVWLTENEEDVDSKTLQEIGQAIEHHNK